MKGLVLYPNGKFVIKDFEEPEYKSIGKEVGGWIEVVRPRRIILPERFIMVVNEEGRLLDLPWNPIAMELYGGIIAGTVVFIREDYTLWGDLDFADSSEEQIQHLKRILSMIED